MKSPIRAFVWILISFNGLVYGQTSLDDGVNYLQNLEMEKAETIFSSHKNQAEAIEYLGDIASFRKQWDVAISHYQQLVDRYPENATYNFKLGGAMGLKAMEVSKFNAVFLLDDIKTHLAEAARLDAQHSESRRALVELYMQLPALMGGDEQLARNYQRELEKINLIDAYLASAFINAEEDEKPKAKSNVIKAMDLANKNPSLLSRNYLNFELAEAAAKYHIKPEESLELLKHYVQEYGYKDLKAPEWAYLKMAEIYFDQKNKTSAMENVDKALSLKPGFKEAQQLKKRIKDIG